jgi:hypothetical protein
MFGAVQQALQAGKVISTQHIQMLNALQSRPPFRYVGNRREVAELGQLLPERCANNRRHPKHR